MNTKPLSLQLWLLHRILKAECYIPAGGICQFHGPNSYATSHQYTYRSLAFLSSLAGELGSRWESSGGSSFPWASNHARSSRSFLLFARSTDGGESHYISE